MSFVVPEVIAMCLGLLEGVAQAPAAVAELPCEAQPAAAVLSLQAVPVLREISESDLRLILPARVELVAVFVASAIPMAFRLAPFCFCSASSTATETKPLPRSAERKVDCRD
jgi:hypothetical protein